jgi:hypothetical protein
VHPLMFKVAILMFALVLRSLHARVAGIWVLVCVGCGWVSGCVG